MTIGRREMLNLTVGLAATSVLDISPREKATFLGDGATDASDRLVDIFSQMAVTGQSSPLAGVYKVSRPIIIPRGIIIGGNVTFDFTGADPADFPGACLLVRGTGKRALPRLSQNLKISDRFITFKAAHKLSRDAAFQLSGTVDFAGNGYRPYYRKGEIFRVARVIDAQTVEVLDACRDSYPASSVTCWHRSGEAFSQKCKMLKVLAPDDIQFAIRFIGIDRSDISNIHAEGGSVSAIDIVDCFNVTGKNLNAHQRSNIFDGYGVSIDACQEIKLSGVVHGYFNGIATGGGSKDVDGLIGMNRDIHFEGRASSDPKGGLAGANFHGNTEFSSYRGVFKNGVVLAGNNNQAHGEFIGKSGQSALIFSEMHGHSFLVTGWVRTTGAELPSNVGAINMGSGGHDYGKHARYGGRTIIDVAIDAPQASRIVLWRTTNLKRRDVILEFRRLELIRSHPSVRFMVLSKVQGDSLPLIQVRKWDILDKKVPIKWSIDANTEIQGLDRRLLIAA